MLKQMLQKHSVPGYHYFKKIYSFMDSHCIVGEIFLECLKGACKENGESGTGLCYFCSSTREQCCDEIEHVARPFPDNESDGHHHLPFSKTPANNRLVDDYMPRIQLKPAYTSGRRSLDDPTSISKFSREFVVAEGCVKDYLEYLTLLDLKKDKRKKERHIIQQQIQGFTQEEGSPLCSNENEEEHLSSDDESVQTDYVLAEIGGSS